MRVRVRDTINKFIGVFDCSREANTVIFNYLGMNYRVEFLPDELNEILCGLEFKRSVAVGGYIACSIVLKCSGLVDRFIYNFCGVDLVGVGEVNLHISADMVLKSSLGDLEEEILDDTFLGTKNYVYKTVSRRFLSGVNFDKLSSWFPNLTSCDFISANGSITIVGDDKYLLIRDMDTYVSGLYRRDVSRCYRGKYKGCEYYMLVSESYNGDLDMIYKVILCEDNVIYVEGVRDNVTVLGRRLV